MFSLALLPFSSCFSWQRKSVFFNCIHVSSYITELRGLSVFVCRVNFVGNKTQRTHLHEKRCKTYIHTFIFVMCMHCYPVKSLLRKLSTHSTMSWKELNNNIIIYKKYIISAGFSSTTFIYPFFYISDRKINVGCWLCLLQTTTVRVKENSQREREERVHLTHEFSNYIVVSLMHINFNAVHCIRAQCSSVQCVRGNGKHTLTACSNSLFCSFCWWRKSHVPAKDLSEFL